MRSGESLTSALLNLKLKDAIGLANANCACIEKNHNSILLQDLCYFFRHVPILAFQQLTGRRDNGHATAETTKQLTKLESDVTAAKHQQVLGQSIELHD